MFDLSQDIADGTNINWSRFKKLKNLQKSGNKLDAFDMYNFCRFFKKLYQEPTLTAERINDLRIDRNFMEVNELHELLNEEISQEELDAAINQLKDGKAVAEDVIANEFLKWSRPITR